MNEQAIKKLADQLVEDAIANSSMRFIGTQEDYRQLILDLNTNWRDHDGEIFVSTISQQVYVIFNGRAFWMKFEPEVDEEGNYA